MSGAGQPAGRDTVALITAVLDARRHPQQAYRSCIGLLRLADCYGDARLEVAAARALAIGSCSYRSVESILRHRLDGGQSGRPGRRRPRPPRSARQSRNILVPFDNLDMRSRGYAGHERCCLPSQQAKHGGKRTLKHARLFVARQSGSRQHERPDTCLTQGVELDFAFSDVLVFGDQNPAPSADLGEPLKVWCATPEGVVLHVREMTLGEQHSRDGTGRHALINEKLVRVVRRRGRA